MALKSCKSRAGRKGAKICGALEFALPSLSCLLLVVVLCLFLWAESCTGKPLISLPFVNCTSRM